VNLKPKKPANDAERQQHQAPLIEEALPPNLKTQEEIDQFWMSQALKLAQRTAELDEVPVGALLVIDGKVIGQAFNLKETWASSLGHAELIAIHRSSRKLGAWRLLNSTLYVTLEPCVMCSGAIQQSRIPRVVFGAFDPKGGALNSLYQIGADQRLNHRFDVVGGVLEKECAEVLSSFFRKKRAKRTPAKD
jgi:tRNA(adenine34) deaminase